MPYPHAVDIGSPTYCRLLRNTLSSGGIAWCSMHMTPVPTTSRTVLFAVAVAFVCSLVVSLVVVWARPLQELRPQLERVHAIVRAAGETAELSDFAASAAYLDLEARVFALSSGAEVAAKDPHTVPPWPVAGGPDRGVIYIARNAGEVTRVVVPMQATGMW